MNQTENKYPCLLCDETGKFTVYFKDGKKDKKSSNTCMACAGTGKLSKMYFIDQGKMMGLNNLDIIERLEQYEVND